MIWFTSDPHYHHKAILQFCKNRVFPNVEAMEERLIKNWNDRVDFTDTVIVVGDFSFGSSADREHILNRLNGFKVLVQGNHDKAKRCPKGFELMVSRLSIRVGGVPVTVSHYPLKWTKPKRFLEKLKAFPRKIYQPRYLDRMDEDKGQYHIHGHTHSTIKFRGNQIHVGVDAWDLYPVSEKKICQYIQRRESLRKKGE